MNQRILTWSIIGTFLGLCVWSDWPADPWDRASQIAGMAIAAAIVGLFVAAWLSGYGIPLLHRIGREGIGPALWDGAKGFALVVAACVGAPRS